MNFDVVFFDNNENLLDSLHLQDEIRCSFDPNDKQSWPDRKGEEISPYTMNTCATHQISEYGNDTAFYVRLDDVLDPHLDRRSLMILDASHDVRAELCNGDTLCFIFDNILLTDSTTNYKESEGYVTFAIDDLPDTPEGTVITNIAGIVFDQNKAVITNTVQNTIVDQLPCPASDIDQIGSTLVAAIGGSLYQWYDCNSNILLYTSQDNVFSPQASGTYYAKSKQIIAT